MLRLYESSAQCSVMTFKGGMGEGWKGGSKGRESAMLLLLLSPFSRVRLCAIP